MNGSNSTHLQNAFDNITEHGGTFTVDGQTYDNASEFIGALSGLDDGWAEILYAELVDVEQTMAISRAPLQLYHPVPPNAVPILNISLKGGAGYKLGATWPPK